VEAASSSEMLVPNLKLALVELMAVKSASVWKALAVAMIRLLKEPGGCTLYPVVV
jgi:hypothetical protein